MSLSSAISASVSALNVQSSALATVANNLANSSTVGYKAAESLFSSLLTSSVGAATTGGVTVATQNNVSLQGLLATSTVDTYMAIDGKGMFVVTADPDSNELSYTRNGQFTIDTDGYLTYNGYYLQGWATDSDGTVVSGTNSSTMTAIDTDAVASPAQATSAIAMEANLPAEAAVGDSFTSTFEVFDSLGTAGIMSVTWTKTAENSWTASFSDPTLSSDETQTIGTVSSDEITLTFNDDGTLASTDPSPPALSITGWTTGAGDSDISLDLGTAGGTDGMTQYSTGAASLSVSLETEQDGVAYGTLSGISVGDDGTIFASFTNGSELAIYKVAIATFNNVNGLSSGSNGIYTETAASGAPSLHLSGEAGAGTIYGGYTESSTTDTNLEFSRMMAAQQAYSGAAQAMTTANSMFDTLMNAVR